MDNLLAMADEEVSSKEQKVDPWTVQAAEGEATIDYDKLIGTIIRKKKYVVVVAFIILLFAHILHSSFPTP